MISARRFALVFVLPALAAACARKPSPPPAVSGAPAADAAAGPAADFDARRAAALGELALARKASLGDVSRAITLPSIERLLEDADDVRAHVTDPARDLAFVRRMYDQARGFADVLVNGEDPYDYARGALVKAYRSEWDGTLQPYALYVPPGYDKKRPWPLVVTLHGARSNHRHQLRRAFGLDNRPGETDAEATRNELPLPDVPALVVAPYGRGEIMGYDGLGQEDVLRVIADVRRAYNVDPDAISLTGLSMGGGGTWQIGLGHPELFAALAPICGVTDVRRLIDDKEKKDYDLAALEALSAPAFAENAAHMKVFIFHGDADPRVPVEDSRRMVARFKALGWLGKNVTYTEYPGVLHNAWVRAYADAKLLKTLAGVKRDPKSVRAPRKAVPKGRGIVGLWSKTAARERPHIYVYGTAGTAEETDAAKKLATSLADWGPGVAVKLVVKADKDVTDDDKERFAVITVGKIQPTSVAARGSGGSVAFVGTRAYANVDHQAPDNDRDYRSAGR